MEKRGSKKALRAAGEGRGEVHVGKEISKGFGVGAIVFRRLPMRAVPVHGGKEVALAALNALDNGRRPRQWAAGKGRL